MPGMGVLFCWLEANTQLKVPGFSLNALEHLWRKGCYILSLAIT